MELPKSFLEQIKKEYLLHQGAQNHLVLLDYKGLYRFERWRTLRHFQPVFRK